MNKMRQWAAVTAAASLLVVIAGYMLMVKPQRSDAANFRKQTQSVQSSIGQLQSQINQLLALQKSQPEQERLLAQIATKVPDNPALPALIRQLSAAADSAGVNLVSMAPGLPTLVQVPVAAVSAASAAAAPSASSSTSGAPVQHAPAAVPLASIPVQLQVQGSYFNIEQFFYAMESLQRALLVSQFALVPFGGPASSGPSASTASSSTTSAATVPPGTINAAITASIFMSPSAAVSVPTTGK